MSKSARSRPLAQNRRARHEYEVLETLEAGIVLLGTEVKSVRQGQVQLREGWVEVRDQEAYLVGVHISPYTHGNRDNHDPERPRKLLLNRREINKLYGRLQTKGLTAVPLSLYLSQNRIKVELGVVRGKRLHDKREAARKRELDREIAQAMGKDH